MNLKNVDRALEEMDLLAKGGRARGMVPFRHFLALAVKDPDRLMRNVFQQFHDMIRQYLGEGVQEYPDDPESIGFVRYDCFNLLADKVDNPFFADRLFANRLVNLVSDFRRGAQQNKIYIFDGPTGCGKSTFLNNLLARFQEYSETEAGMRYEAVWLLDLKRLGQNGDGGLELGRNRAEALLSQAFDQNGQTPGAKPPGESGGQRYLPSFDQPEPRLDGDVLEVPCPSHDHPFMIIPKAVRRKFLDTLYRGEDFWERLFTEKEYDWVFREEACTICQSLYQSLLETLGSPGRVFEMLGARPSLVSRRLGEGVCILNPGDVTSKRHYYRHPRLQERINRHLHSAAPVKYLYSRYARTNNGVYALMDIKGMNTDRLIELHNIISEGVHKVESIEERVSSLFLALMNPEDRANIQDIPSFSDRIEYVNIPYVMDIRTEVEILLSIFGHSLADRFLPRVLHNFARVIISTRLEDKSPVLDEWLKDPGRYRLFCDESWLLLKMELYAGLIPAWLGEEEIKRFTAKRRRRLIAESEAEGRKGFSGRDSIKIFGQFYSTYAKEKGLISMKMLKSFFNKVRPDLGGMIPEGFMDALLSMYDYTVLEQIKESLYFFNEERISKNIQNYLCALSFETGARLVCTYTGEDITVGNDFLNPIEDNILGPGVDEKRRLRFRNDTQKEYTAKTLTRDILVSGLSIHETELYQKLRERYIYNLKAKVLDPFIENENFRRAIKDFRTSEFRTYDKKIRNDVSMMIKNLRNRFEYTALGAREVCMDIIDRGVAAKFADRGEAKPEEKTEV